MRRLVRTAVASAATLALLAGCGGGSGSQTIELSPVAAMERVAENAGTDSARYTLEMSGAGMRVQGSGAYRGGDDPAAQMTFDSFDVAGLGLGGSDGMEFRLVDDVMYLRGAALPGLGSGWMKLPVDDAQAQGNTFGGLDPTLADPRAQLEKMLDTEDVREVGRERVDGVETTHYVARVSPQETGTVITEKRSGSSNELSRELERKLEDSFRESLGVDSPAQVDVWVDDQYRARKMVMTLPFLGDVTMTMRFSDFGSDVDVEAPADADLMDLGDLLGGSLGDLLGDDFDGAFGSDSDFSGLSKEFEDKLRKQIEKGLSGSGFADDDLDALIRSS